MVKLSIRAMAAALIRQKLGAQMLPSSLRARNKHWEGQHVFTKSLIFVLSLASMLSLKATEDVQSPFSITEREFLLQMGPKLYAIANNPDLIKKLDQRKDFVSEDAYDTMRLRSIARTQKLTSKLFENKNLTTSLCIDDEKVFFEKQKEDCSILGWLPLVRTIHGIGKTLNFEALAILNEKSEAELSVKWKAMKIESLQSVLPKTEDTAEGSLVTNLKMSSEPIDLIKNLLRLAFDLNIKRVLVLTKEDGHFLCGKAIASFGAEPGIEVSFACTSRILCIKVPLQYRGGSPIVNENLLKENIGLTPGIWPPKVEWPGSQEKK